MPHPPRLARLLLDWLAPGNEALLHAHATGPVLEPDPLVQEGPNAGP